MKTIKFSVYIGILLLGMSCSSDDDNDTMSPDPTTPVATNPIPDVTTSYNAHVKTIIDTHCIECHAATPTQGAPMPLITFSQVVAATKDRNLFDRMNTTNSLKVMPQSGRLPDATILVVQDWIADGLTEE